MLKKKSKKKWGDAMEQKIIEAFRSIQERVESLDISKKIDTEIEIINKAKPDISKIYKFFIRTALASAAIIAVIILLKPFSESKSIKKNLIKDSYEKTTLQYAQISGKETKQYYFKSENNNKMIVWIQKKGD